MAGASTGGWSDDFRLGVLMLDSRFPRPPGDVGNPATWPFPVDYQLVRGALPGPIVRELHPAQWLEPFLAGARALEGAGASLITTSCGFLVLFQSQLSQALSVPVLSSSLLQVPWLASTVLPGKRVGIMTIDAASLSPAHLRAAGIGPELPLAIQGMTESGGYFSGQILGNHTELDLERAGREHEQAARALLERHPDLGAIVLECTNMRPYVERIRAATGLPVFDLTTLVGWWRAGLDLSNRGHRGQPATRTDPSGLNR